MNVPMLTGGLKEYYIRLQNLYENALSLLNGINQSLSTNAPEISVTVADTDDAKQTVKIPSFLYLENRLEELDNTISNLFKMPESGESWFTNSGDSYKLNLVRTNTAPVSPVISNSSNIYASLTDNNVLKDLVSPKTYVRLNISNMPDNMEKIVMKKITLANAEIFNSLAQLGISSYDEYRAALYNLRKGDDYNEYESIINLPIKKDTFKSAFSILEVIGEPWNEYATSNSALSYKLRLNTLEYSNQEDTSISYYLKAGDHVCLGNGMFKYVVKSTSPSDNTVTVEEEMGHINIVPVSENSEMVFQIWNESYDQYHYVDIPLEENEFVVIFIASLYNNIRSNFSSGLPINLNTIYMKTPDGISYITDAKGRNYTYMDYYKKYCMNIGDLILGITETSYPQLSNFSPSVLSQLQDGDDVADFVNSTIDNETVLKVVAINKHLSDDVTSEDIISLHAQKNDLNAKLQTIQSNISQVYSTLISTDFSQDMTVNQASLQEELKGYYADRTDIQSQLNNIVDNINVKASELNISIDGVKYRIRGAANVKDLEEYIQTIAGERCSLIGLDVEYKYKSTNKDTHNITTIGNSTFTDWNRLTNIDRQRRLKFTATGYEIEYVQYDLTDNIIKWNQIDIPITSGEDVIVRVRYKYNIGQPFINIYSPWSDEITVAFPDEFAENVEVSDILAANNKDTVKSTFSKILINDGYAEHVQDKVIANEQVFFHMPENIYSGFNTAENNLISLKDKLNQITNDIDKYKTLIEQETNTKFDVYLNYDDEHVLLTPNTINKINIFNTDHITDKYIKKNMQIIIKNTGDTPVNLYSIFPGNVDMKLIDTDQKYYNEEIVNYDRVPIYFNNIIDGQHLGQWMYFRSNNPYTGEDIYLNSVYQNLLDFETALNNNEPMHFSYLPEDYIDKNNNQVIMPFRKRTNNEFNYDSLYSYMHDGRTHTKEAIDDYIKNNLMPKNMPKYSYEYAYDETFKIEDDPDQPFGECRHNKYITRYEDIIATKKNGEKYSYITFDDNTSITSFTNGTEVESFGGSRSDSSYFIGGFLYPSLLSLSQIVTDGSEHGSHIVSVGSTEAIPVEFEYYVDGEKQNKITKSLYFDIRNSLISNPLHYMIEVTGNYDYTTSGDIYTNIDELINETNE